MSNKKFEIPPLILPYFEELARIGVYGDEVGAVVTFILRKEVMHLIETKVLDRVKIVAMPTEPAADSRKPAKRRPKPQKATTAKDEKKEGAA